MSSSTTSRFISAPIDQVFAAFTVPSVLVQWQVPDNMTARIHRHDIRPGGSYEMSLYYDDPETPGKTGGNEDRYTATFLVFDPPKRIVESISFDADDPAGRQPMTMTVDLSPDGAGTHVTITFDDLPASVSPQENNDGTRQSLAKLALLLAHDS